MRRPAAALTALLTLAVTTLTIGLATSVQAAAVSSTSSASLSAHMADFGCAHPLQAGQARCFGVMKAHRTASGRMSPFTTGSPTTVGYVPSDLRSAYNLGSTSGSGRTVAIVDAMNDPNAESDLATYRSAYGLPSCTTANGCFRKVNQNGQASPLPSADYGWAEEISLDLDMVSATCPGCHIL
ncbi:peptidase S8, partial [Streptomyces sp. NPDC004533]